MSAPKTDPEVIHRVMVGFTALMSDAYEYDGWESSGYDAPTSAAEIDDLLAAGDLQPVCPHCYGPIETADTICRCERTERAA